MVEYCGSRKEFLAPHQKSPNFCPTKFIKIIGSHNPALIGEMFLESCSKSLLQKQLVTSDFVKTVDSHVILVKGIKIQKYAKSAQFGNKHL